MAKLIVVGAGVHGLLTARRHRERGWDVTVYDKGPVPNPMAASHGMHRLIHPWSKAGDADTALRAHRALDAWKAILDDIGCSGFVETGVLAVDPLAIRLAGAESLDSAQLKSLMPVLAGHHGEAALFPRFGLLLAAEILRDLADMLRRRGVEIVPGQPVTSVAPASGEVMLGDGAVVGADKVVVAAGAGTRRIVARSSFEGCDLSPERFHTMRCYVLYGVHPDVRRGGPCWASLGDGDLWGMPPVLEMPLKLGCGALTRPERLSAPDDLHRVERDIERLYRDRFPRFARLSVSSVRFNHWVRIDLAGDVRDCGKCRVITSDDGGGFKFAPLVVEET